MEGAKGQPLTLNLPAEDAKSQGGTPQAVTTDKAVPAAGASSSSAQAGQPATPQRHGSSNSAKSQEGSPASNKNRPPSAHQRRHPPGRPPPLPPYPNTYTNNVGNKGSGNARLGRTGAHNGIIVESPTGGVQVTLDGGGSWSDLARQDATLPTDAAGVANEAGKAEGSGSVFSFLRGRRGRANSPKPKERGVLGKEGARVVIG